MILIWKVVFDAPWATGTNPDQKPSFMGSQGVAKADWATEWLLGQNLKVTVSPSAAVMLAGSKVRPLFPATTMWSAAIAEPARAEVATAKVEKRIMIGCEEERLARSSNKGVIKWV